MANDKNKNDLGKRDDESIDEFEARTKTMTDEERAGLDTDDDLSDNLDSADSSKGD